MDNTSGITELFQDAKSRATPIIVERIVNDIDEIVKRVRFPDWQHTTAGDGCDNLPLGLRTDDSFRSNRVIESRSADRRFDLP